MGGTTTLSVHRCRFVDYLPSAITSLAFPPLPLPSLKGKKKVDFSIKVPKVGTLVVGRANGNIEICEWTGSQAEVQAPQAWVVQKTLPGPHQSKVDSLALTLRHAMDSEDVPSLVDLRLFSTGGGSELLEWDILNGCIRRTISSQGGSIWSIAANPSSTLLALGCEDGSIHLCSLEDDSLSHFRHLDRSKSRILSVAWGPPVPREAKKGPHLPLSESDDSDDDEDEWLDSWIVAGCSDSSLRKWDIATGRVLDRMGTDKMRGERTLVWTVGALGDGTIVSGDSLGMVKFWDSRTCTQLQSFQAHGADVLCLIIGSDGTTVYTSGVDQKTAQFSLIKTSGSSLLSSASRWVQSSSKRMHSHDVRTLAIWPPHTPLPSSHHRRFPIDVAPILASGGLDMSVVLAPAALPQTTTSAKIINPLSTSTVATFEDAYHRRLAYSSGPSSTSAIKVAKQTRLVMCMREASLTVWRILPKSRVEEADQELSADGQAGGWEQVLDMVLNVRTNLIASAISDDGAWLVVSDFYETKLFSLEATKSGDLKPKRVREFGEVLQQHIAGSPTSTGASSLVFSPDSSKLVMTLAGSSYILVIDLGMDTGKPRVLRRFSQHRVKDVIIGERTVKGRRSEGVEDVEMTEVDTNTQNDAPSMVTSDIDEPAFSKPVIGAVTRMAVSPDGQWLATTDDHRRTHIFNLDSIQHHTVLPTFPHPVHALAFSPSTPSLLLLAFANNNIEMYDVEARQFPPWSRELCASLPKRFTHLHDPVLGVALMPAAEPGSTATSLALFWGSTWICKVQLDAPAGWGGFGKKRRRKQHAPPGAPTKEDGQNFKLITHYRPILFVDFLDMGELLVVERPLVDVLAKLPPAYFKPKYGAS